MTKIKKYPKKYILLLAVVVLCLGGIAFYFTRDAQTKTAVKPEGLVNLNPPTEEEKQAGNLAKAKAVEQEQARNAPPAQTGSSKNLVVPTITYAGLYNQQVEVGGYVSGVFEDGGKCTLELQKDGKSFTSIVTGVKGSSTVNCPVMSIQRSVLEAGQWQATISYSSPTSEGKSQPRTVEVK